MARLVNLEAGWLARQLDLAEERAINIPLGLLALRLDRLPAPMLRTTAVPKTRSFRLPDKTKPELIPQSVPLRVAGSIFSRSDHGTPDVLLFATSSRCHRPSGRCRPRLSLRAMIVPNFKARGGPSRRTHRCHARRAYPALGCRDG